MLLKSLLMGLVVEIPFAIWGYCSPTGHGAIYSPAFMLVIIHAPAVIVLSLLSKPFAANSNDGTFPMTAVFLTQAIFFSVLSLAILLIRERRKLRTERHSGDDNA